MRLVLVIHTEERRRQSLSSALSRGGFRVATAKDSQTGLAQLRQLEPDLIIVSGVLDGDLCVRIKQAGAFPIIVVGMEPEMSRVMMIESGADTYLNEPVSDIQLLAWVRALLRRYKRRQEDFRLDPETRHVQWGKNTTELNSTEFRLFSCLSGNKGRVMSYGRLIDDVWGGRVGLDTLHFYIRRLKQKLGIDSASPYRLLNYRGEGYCFVAEKCGGEGDYQE